MAVPGAGWTYVLDQVNAITFDTVDINVNLLATIFQKYVDFGSQRFTLSKSELTITANRSEEFEGKEITNVVTLNGLTYANTVLGLLAAGTKFLDAVIWLTIPVTDRPFGSIPVVPKNKQHNSTFPLYSDQAKIGRCMFFYYFYLLTRARPPTTDAEAGSQPVPNFLRVVLGIDETAASVASYLASFSLDHLDPRWVRHIQFVNLSQESMSRFGLGVAGYRLASPFRLRTPDLAGHEKYASAISVAQSFAMQPACWDFHPATRSPNVLTKYGNINKNLENLLRVSYTKETLQAMVTARILYQLPNEQPAYTNYTQWLITDQYLTTSRIFPAVM